MGNANCKSKPKDRFGRTKKNPFTFSAGGKDTKRSDDISMEHEFSSVIRDRLAEDEDLNILRHTIQYNPDLFVLNNLMMSVQFFENYDEEIASIRQTLVSPKEADLNARLPPQKHTLIPDVLQQHVARRVDFTYIDPTLKLTIELLHPIRIFVAFENIEVSEENFASPYCSVNETITYNMQLKPSPNHKGYVLLQRLEVNPPKKAVSADDLDLTSMSNRAKKEIDSDGDSLYGMKPNTNGVVDLPTLDKNLHNFNDNEGIYEDRRYRSQGNLSAYPSTSRGKDESIYGTSTAKATDLRRGGTRNLNRQHGKTRLLCSANGSPAGSTSSGYRSGNYIDSDSDYSYARTTYNTPKTSKSSLDSGSMMSGMAIPRQCFRKIEYTPDGKIYAARRERRHKMNSKEQLIRQAHKNRNYNVWYLNSTKFMKHFCYLFTDQLADIMGFDPNINDNVQGGAICQTKLEVLEGTMSTKLEQFEIMPSVTAQWPECAQEWIDRPRATWPHYNVIEKIKEFGCHMIPEGILSEKPDRYQDLEWQLVFPAAERYLETCLTYPQVRVYLIALMLQKTFIRPVDSIFGLTVSHIKNRLFWLIEEDDRPSMWMENRTGASLMKLLNSLYRSISQDSPNLADYFVRDKNLFQEKSYLLRTQKQLKRIIENPVMYVFHAMENIRHSRRFFPRLNFEELFRILTADTLMLANPALVAEVPRQLARPNLAQNDYDQVGGFWDKTNQMNSEQQKIYARKPVTKRSLINPRKAYDQVVEIPVRCETMEPRRTSSLLDFFIRHFIKMAESCHNYRALPQKVAYVDQAERLSILLSEHPTHKDIANTYLEKLSILKRRPLRSRSQNTPVNTSPTEPPKTPKRNPDRAIFVRPLKHRYESPENLVEHQQFMKIPQTGETKEYELESPRSSVYGSQASSESQANQSVVTVTIHEEVTKKVELHNSNNFAPMGDVPTTSSNIKTRVLPIAGTQNESISAETTYI